MTDQPRFSTKSLDKCTAVITKSFGEDGKVKYNSIIDIFIGTDNGKEEAERYAECLNRGVKAFFKGPCPTNDEQEIILDVAVDLAMENGYSFGRNDAEDILLDCGKVIVGDYTVHINKVS